MQRASIRRCSQIVDSSTRYVLPPATVHCRYGVRSRAIERFPVDIETAVYFTCVEAMQNAAKHAGCETSVLISLSRRETLRFEVSDDGVRVRP